MKTKLKAAAIIGLLFSTFNLRSQGTFEAVFLPNTPGHLPVVGYVNNGTIGWAFSPSQDIVISSLGWLTTNLPPASMSIGLWSADGTLLRSTAIDGNNVRVNGNLYESVAPLFVSAGSTMVIGAGTSGGTFNFVAYPHSPTTPPINFAGTAVFYGNGFTFPTVNSPDGDPDRFIPAATFLFQVVPEPSIVSLAAIGGLLFSCHRRRHLLRAKTREEN